ncbi:MAG: HNH endonuclease signature motif containing protein [Desulfuromonadaceae bacterium]
MLTQEKVKALFDYLPTGELIWKVRLSNRINIGDTAGHTRRGGYLITGIGGKIYYNHRLVWLWHHGYLPENYIDHIDRNTSNARIENLREVSMSCNLRNAKQPINNTSGVKGVSFNNKNKTWLAHIHCEGKLLNIGTHKDFGEAVCHRLAVEQALDWGGCDSLSPAALYVKTNITRSLR